MPIKAWARKLKLTVPAVYLCLKDPQTPMLAKIMAGLTVGYALSPIDLIPDFIPVLGYLDDLLILPGLAALAIWLIPKKVYQRNYAAAEGMWQDGRPKKWYYAIPIAVFWAAIALLTVRKFL